MVRTVSNLPRVTQLGNTRGGSESLFAGASILFSVVPNLWLLVLNDHQNILESPQKHAQEGQPSKAGSEAGGLGRCPGMGIFSKFL